MLQTIAIIGAGLAGLTTACRLKQAGCNVMVYEARQRPGGRVFTARIGDGIEELGGKGINDGGEAREMLSLIKELGLETDECAVGRSFFIDDQMYRSSEVFKNVPKATPELYERLKAQAAGAASMSAFLDNFLGVSTPLRRYFEVRTRGYEGCDTTTVSASFYFANLWYAYQLLSDRVVDEEQLAWKIITVRGGSTRLVEALCAQLEGCIRYNKPLCALGRSGDGVRLTFDDEVVDVDRCVLAIPCSTLRDVAIEPDLIPDDQMTMINELQYGTNAKLLLPAQTSSELPDSVATYKAVAWVNPTESVMTVYYGGTEGVFDATTVATLTQKWKEMEPSIVQALSDVVTNPTFEPLQDSFLSHAQSAAATGISWANERYSKGSYSCLAPGQEAAYEETIEQFGQPVRKVFRAVEGKLFFAGEHASIDVPSTMQGAIESGERTALMVKKALLRA